MSIRFVAFTFFMVSMAHGVAAQSGVCKYWQSKVDPRVSSNLEVDVSNETNVLKGIECILQLQGTKTKGLFSGATRDTVSQLFPEASVEVCALYYASYLFLSKWDHASAVALVDKHGRFNSPASVRTAFRAYRKWLLKISSLGLEKAREKHLDPLINSGVHWYGENLGTDL